MFTSKKIIVAATVAAQFVLSSNLLWFDDDPLDNPKDARLDEDDIDLTQAEIEDERRMLETIHNPSKQGFFGGIND